MDEAHPGQRAGAVGLRATPPTRGLYVWGGVGRGKTWLMDLFHENLHGLPKARFHFHRFMQLVHNELGSIIKGRPTPADRCRSHGGPVAGVVPG